MFLPDYLTLWLLNHSLYRYFRRTIYQPIKILWLNLVKGTRSRDDAKIEFLELSNLTGSTLTVKVLSSGYLAKYASKVQ